MFLDSLFLFLEHNIHIFFLIKLYICINYLKKNILFILNEYQSELLYYIRKSSFHYIELIWREKTFYIINEIAYK